jgi:pilus assembly protein Flp/PilA
VQFAAKDTTGHQTIPDCITPGCEQARTLRLVQGVYFISTINEFGDQEMLSIFRQLMKNDHGATAIEYTLIASLIAVAAITAIGKVSTKLNTVLSNVSNAMS